MLKSNILHFALVLACVFEITIAHCKINKLELNLPQGRIKGSYDFPEKQMKFLGIPYASVQERFQGPGKPPSWNGTYEANNGSISCKQLDSSFQNTVGVEDCLVLNIFTPIYQCSKPFAVMVFIHGGGFFAGSSTVSVYNPKYLVQEKVIVVTINYRLGAFGFLCLGVKEAPGNVGLRDQIAALKWIQNNIGYFGGDPNSVTVFGESAGAMAIDFIISSQSAKGLFHKAILESGTILSSSVFAYEPIENARMVASRLGYNTTDPIQLANIFKNTSADDITLASFVDPTNNALAPFLFVPCIDIGSATERPLIRSKPKDLLKESRPDIPLIIGLNNKEGISWAQEYIPITCEKIEENINDVLIPDNLLFDNEANKTAYIKDLINVYFKNDTAKDGLINYFTDMFIRYPLTIVSENYKKQPNTKLYNYYFTYDSTRNVGKLTSKLPNVAGADHTDELFYLFNSDLNEPRPNSKDRAFINNMVKFWTSFAKTGKPKGKTEWVPSKNRLNFIELGENIGMITLPHNDRMEFWRNIYRTNRRY